ncbi:hypothetical protein ACROYT_G015492 [Oculina patagonica]
MMVSCLSHLSKAQDSSSSTSSNTVNGCYTFHDVDGTWEEARDACRKMGAHLVTMETTDEWSKVKSLIAEKVKKSGSYTQWYIGLRKESKTWKWTEAGSPGVVVATDDSRWQSGEPSAASGIPAEDCAEIYSNYLNKIGKFNNVECNVKYPQRVDSHGNPLPPRGYICENY